MNTPLTPKWQKGKQMELYYVARVQEFTDGDGIEQYEMSVNFMEKGIALKKVCDAIPGTLNKLNEKVRFMVNGETGRYNYGYFTGCFVEIAPANNNGFIDGNEISRYFAEYNRSVSFADEQVEKMLEEINPVEEEDDLVDTVDYARETAKELARKHRKEDIKAKERLRRIYPISTDSIRQNRNGAYIRKGNTYRGIREWKRMDRKISREEGKRICRNYVDELEIPEKEIRAEIKELRDSRKWAVNALCDVIEEMSRKSNFDLLDAVKEIRGEIDEIDTQIEALKDVLRTGEADGLIW